MVNIKEKRIEKLIEELSSSYYIESMPLHTKVTVSKHPIPYESLPNREFRTLALGEQWGELWDSSWFKFTGTVPLEWQGKEVVALIDIGGEGCVFKEGSPYCGITYKRTETLFERKRRIMLYSKAQGGELVDLLIEGAANGVTGGIAQPWGTPWPYFQLNQAELVIFDRATWNLSLDMDFLFQLYRTMNPSQPRAKKILAGLNRVANLTPLQNRITEALDITQSLIHSPAYASELTAWSIGHAHIDVAWLWRYRETRRKTGRTFSTALKMMEEYSDYVFGASQPQLFAWLKEDYPKLYASVKEKISTGRFECQGGMWVEPDMNVTGGESLVRQCLYGKKFFKDEFAVDINNLWLPDVFGYSAALPQILKKSGIDFFMTQKISWNETNTFPHHTFMWTGIDGTSICTHFLPTNNYNCDNTPQQMVDANMRFSQSDIRDGYLNLYGIGDGGGGPSRRHIEFALRSKECEGVPKIKLAKAGGFFHNLGTQGTLDLPEWRGELYLEMHRGTLTTQALMKKHNRLLELKLRDIELFGALAEWKKQGSFQYSEVENIWKETLTNQFHDVLPGSSIKEVYEDVHAISRRNLESLYHMEELLLQQLFPISEEHVITLINTQPWKRKEIVEIQGAHYQVEVPALGYMSCTQEDLIGQQDNISSTISFRDNIVIENSLVQVTIADTGAISSIILKELGREMLGSEGAGVFALFEDKPYVFDAWEVSAYYQETVPEFAKLQSQKITVQNDYVVKVEQLYSIGNSTIVQTIELRNQEALLRFFCEVDWKEHKKMLRLCTNTTISWPTATYEIQYGTIERPTHSNTSWDKAKFEVCGHRFADLSQPDYGLALINDCKYGHRIHGQNMELTLLKSPTYPDPTADRGVHQFSYAYYPHAGTFKDSNVLQIAHNFNSPITVLENRWNSNTTSESWVTTSSSQVKIEVVKLAENKQGIIVRCYETLGAHCACVLNTTFPFVHVWEVNLLEEKELMHSDWQEQSINLSFAPFEIKTLLLESPSDEKHA